MQAVVENLSGLTRKIKVTVPPDQIQEEVNKRIKELAKKVKIKGFRAGKVPDSVVRMQFGGSVREEVIRDILWQTLQQAFQEKKIYPAGNPHIEVTNVKEGEPLEYEAKFEVFPEVKLAHLDKISVERLHAEVNENHVSDVIEKLRKQNVKWTKVHRESKEGDLITIDFEGFLDDKPFEGGSAKDFNLELGSKRMIPGFEDALINKKAGEDVEVDITFPKDYQAAHLASKPAKFKVKVKKVAEAELPELDEAFAKDLGVSDGTVAGLQDEVRENLKREIARRIRENVKQQLITKLLELNEIQVPESLVEEEIKRMQSYMKRQMAAQTDQKNIPELPREQFEKQARQNVTLGLLLSQWIQENEIKVDPKRVRQRIEEIASGYHRPEDIVNWYYGNKEALTEIENGVLEEQAMDKLIENIKVTDKNSSYEEVMGIKERGDE